MGFYHPATLVKDAQRRGVRFRPIDVQASQWDCVVEDDGAIRIGLRYVDGLRAEVGQRIVSLRPPSPIRLRCSGFGAASRRAPLPEVRQRRRADDRARAGRRRLVLQPLRAPVPAPRFTRRSRLAGEAAGGEGARFTSIEHLVAATGIREDELTTLASIGALNAFGCDRREALWQVARAIRPAGALFDEAQADRASTPAPIPVTRVAEARVRGNDGAVALPGPAARGPLLPLTPIERVVADYDGTGLTIGPHPMTYRRAEMALRGVLRATDLPKARAGRRVRVAGAVITRQRPGTAKGFVFLTVEDETGIANVIVRPDVYDAHRMTVVEAPFLLIEGILQQQEGVTSIRAERLYVIGGGPPVGETSEAMPPVPSRDFR